MRSQNKTVQNEHVILRRVSRIQEKVNQSDYDAAMAQLYIDIFSGEIPTTLCNQDGEEITTSDGAALQAVRKIRKGGG